MIKRTQIMAVVAVLAGYAALAGADEVQTLHMSDAAWVRDMGDRLARCAGTYRGAAQVMRRTGRRQAANYAEGVGSGALFAAYLMLTAPATRAAELLANADVNAHIEALARSANQHFLEMSSARDPAMPAELRSCTRMSSLQSLILQGSTAIPNIAEAAATP